MAYLTTDLVTAVKRRAAIPINQVTFQNTDIYQLGDEEIRSKMTPLINKCMEEYYVQFVDLPIIANQANYEIPSRAVAAGLRNVQIVIANDLLSRIELPRLDPSDLYSTYTGGRRIVIQKNGFYPESNHVVIYPTPTNNDNFFRLSYVCRPNSLVDPSACGQVASINTALNQITLVSIPTTFTTSTPLDFINANPGFDWAAQDQTPTVIVANTLTFATPIPPSLLVGDYICLAGQTCVIQVPVELQPLLVQYVTVRILSAQNDAQALQAAIAELEKLEANALLLISPRIIGKVKRCSNSKGLQRWT